MTFNLVPAAGRSLSLALAMVLGACAGTSPDGAPSTSAMAACAAMAAPVAAARIGLPSGGATIDSATLIEAAAQVAAPAPANTVTPAVPQYCKVLGRIAPVDAKAPPILFQVNLPTQWNGRSVQFGGGGFNGVLITGQGLAPSGRLDQPSPLARGYMTYGTDSGHQNAPGQPPQAFALNDEALDNFAHAAYKKVRDVAVELAQRRYGRAPQKLYYVGSSEGGREGLTMAQRYPNDFDGIFSRVPVINFVGLQHAGTRAGLEQTGDGWLPPAKVKLIADATLAACDASDGLADGIVSDIAGCSRRFDPASLRCTAGADADGCLNDAQIGTVRTLHARYTFDFALANGVQSYPGWEVGGGENAPGAGSVGGWRSWQTGTSRAVLPPAPTNGIAWIFGSGTIQYLIAKDPAFDVRGYRPQDFAARVQAVSRLMDSTDPDLSAFAAHGGKLVMLEHTADYAQSAYAGIEYHQSVVDRMGQAATDRFVRLYTAPGVDHVGTGAPANVDMLDVVSQWAEQGKVPDDLQVVMQAPVAPFAATDARPLCRWPAWPRYRGSGDPKSAASFECARR